MSVQNYNSKIHLCGNCNYFVCNRQLTSNQQFVIVEPECTGKCFGKYKGMTRKAKDRFTSCWQMWDLLNGDKKTESLTELQKTIETIKKANPRSHF